MRITQKRKRSSYGSNRATKRRRFKRTYRRRRGRVNIVASSRQGGSRNPFQIRKKRTRKSTLRKELYRQTQFKTHYKTVNVTSNSVVTPNNVTQQQGFIQSVFDSSAGNEFWHSAGGLQDPSFGEVPSFAGAGIANDPVTCILRGGRMWMSITNPQITADVTSGQPEIQDNVQVRVQLIWPKQVARNFDDTVTSNTFQSWIGGGALAWNTAARPIGLSLQDMPDYNEYLYPPVLDKSFLLQPGDTYQLYHKILPTKIDCGVFKDGGGWFPYWNVTVHQVANVLAGGVTCTLQTGFNMSFSVADTLT